ncbi:hypothetical protein [Sphingomonas turrisvirgatae]|uniref:Uncharacterized protein n=1 Tax=Sphingomonas turrisvirgatae TaxID=1888892 RepID=A0A1E3LSI1_9SPHN|nr:hypothetical protein [Sphingomonas turrisvirgatae]ODP36722.1 hypothetical protein BFL28_05025 [Sphingomonas turrisvirgatae]
MQGPMWIGVGAWLTLAAGSGIADWRRTRRSDPDAVGFMPWTLVQILAILGAVVTAALAIKG